MPERQIVVDNERLSYSGIFDIKEIMKIIKDWAKDKAYFMIESSHTESVKEDGKYADIKLEPFKKLTDYAKSKVKIRITVDQAKDRVVDIDGKKVKMYEGRVGFLFDGILETDYEARWEGKPVFYFLRTIFEKYVYAPFISKFEQTVKNDVDFLKTQLKSYLNMQKLKLKG